MRVRKGYTCLLFGLGIFGYVTAQDVNSLPIWNPSLSFEERVNDLVCHLTLEEKIAQMLNAALAIPRLAIPAYDWWNEVAAFVCGLQGDDKKYLLAAACAKHFAVHSGPEISRHLDKYEANDF